MAASYPSAVKTYTTKVDGPGNTVLAAHVNELQDEITALEQALLTNGLAHDLKFVDATYDIGKSGATRPRDGFFSRNVSIGGTLGVTGVATFTAAPVFSAGLGTLTGDLLFTDATYDIGKQAATRPRDLGLSRNLFIGGIRTLGTTVPNVTYMEAPTNSVANNGTFSLGTYLLEGMVLVNEWQNGKCALVFLAGGAAPQIGVQMSGTEWTVTKDNAGTMNIYWLTDHYEIQNKLGSTVNLRVWAFGAGASTNP